MGIALRLNVLLMDKLIKAINATMQTKCSPSLWSLIDIDLKFKSKKVEMRRGLHTFTPGR